ncbi:MAG TPA: V-type ATP synthase subunit I [Candidatus Nanoarchaeia archaeon]|nr:V-type ATP synthase subunit I [Candidatus Nanoarchaeia archaeon]
MLKPHEMSSVIIAGPQKAQEAVVKELHQMKILHIIEHSKSEAADIGKPFQSAAKLSETLVKIRAMIAALNVQKNGSSYPIKKSLEIETTALKLSKELSEVQEDLRKTEEETAKNGNALQELSLLESINIPLETLTTYKSLSYLAGFIGQKKNSHSLKQEISKISNKFMLFSSNSSKKEFVLLFIDIKNKEKAAEILQRYDFSQANLLNIQGMSGTAGSNIKKINEENLMLQSKKESIGKKLDSLKSQYGVFLLAAEEFLSEQLEKAEAPLKFASTQSSFLIRGWVPTGEIESMKIKIAKAAKNKILIQSEAAKKHDKVPVKMKNIKVAKPFEFFMDLYSIPAYSEIDPTFFLFLTFPIFFGLMLGDVGYGALSLCLFLFMKKKMPKAGSFFNVLILSSFVTILFGFFFGEFFGYEFGHPIISREHEMFKLMYLAIGIGIVHANLGLVLGFINIYKNHGLKMAIYEKGSWMLLQVGIALIALEYFNVISLHPAVGITFLAAAIIMLYKGEGIKGIIELPSILTNIMSYSRLMAIGLSSVILAVITNDMSKEFFHKGGFFILAGVLILVVGHAINIMLGLIGSFLHSLRLHYVEFFSKFFHGGAKKYQPFGYKD